MGHGKLGACIGIRCHRNGQDWAVSTGLLLVQKRALERFEDSAPVAGDASLSVSPKHLVRLWGHEEDEDVGGFLDAEIRAERSLGRERLGDQGHVPGESSFPSDHCGA